MEKEGTTYEEDEDEEFEDAKDAHVGEDDDEQHNNNNNNNNNDNALIDKIINDAKKVLTKNKLAFDQNIKDKLLRTILQVEAVQPPSFPQPAPLAPPPSNTSGKTTKAQQTLINLQIGETDHGGWLLLAQDVSKDALDKRRKTNHMTHFKTPTRRKQEYRT